MWQCPSSCKFSACFPLLTFVFFSLIPLFRSWARERNKQWVIVSIYMFSVVLNICKVCHWKHTTLYSLKEWTSCKILVDTSPNRKCVPNGLIQRTGIIVNMVWSMIFQLRDIKVVFDDRLFQHLWIERETKKWKPNFWMQKRLDKS